MSDHTHAKPADIPSSEPDEGQADANQTDTPEAETGEAKPTKTESLSDLETLMWNLEADPWLNPSGAMITVLDRPLNQKHFRRCIKTAIAEVPKLRQRVVPAATKLSNPTWETDPEFDLSYHLNAIALPESACEFQDLLDLTSWLYQQPHDRSRPLWQVLTVDGLEDGRSAIVWRLHHIIGDATTMMRMAEFYMQLKRRDKMPPKVSLNKIFADEIAAQERSTSNPVESLAGSAASTLSSVAKKQTGFVRKALGEVLLWGADPVRAKEFGQETVAKVAATIEQLDATFTPSEADSSGSPLWTNRSRHRTLEAFQLPLDQSKAAAKALGGSINDFFVTGAVIGSLAYHDARETAVENLNLSFVVSTRKDKDNSANAFTPMRLAAPGEAMDAVDRFTQLKALMSEKKQDALAGSGMTSVAGAANLLPTGIVTGSARSQSAGVDFATSNFRGAPIPVFISGGKLVQNVPIGPLAGTAFNITVMSSANNLDFGIFIDPTAVEDPADLRSCIQAAYAELLEVAD